MVSLSAAGLFTVAAMMTRGQALTVVFLALVYGAITFQQAGVFGVLLDIGHKYAGAMGGLLNTAAQAGPRPATCGVDFAGCDSIGS